MLKDTVRVTISAGAGHHLVIEADPDRQVSPNRDNPIDTVRLSLTYRPSDSVYAVVRDQYGNFVAFSTVTAWTSSDSAVAAAPGVRDSGQGVLTAVRAGTSIVTATNQAAPALAEPHDDVVVIVQSYWYDSLRIVNVVQARIDSVLMTTIQDTLLLVQGRRTDSLTWESVAADWQIVDQPLVNVLSAPPRSSSQWLISPSGIGQGRVRVTMGIDSVTAPDTAFLLVKTAPPSMVTLSFITPPDSRRAGDTMLLRVELRNQDGLLQGRYCYPTDANGAYAVYQDTLGTAGRPDSRIINSEGDAIITARATTGNQIGECFVGGIDTIKVVMYYAPAAADSLHKLFLTLGSLSAATDPFRLLPGRIDSLVIMQGGLPAGESASLTAPRDSLVLYTVGYDRWENVIVTVTPLLWTVTGTLHQPSDTMKAAPVFTYTTVSSTVDEQGFIRAYSGPVGDSIEVMIVGTLKRLVSATTRDTNGNGYLDRIDLRFSSLVTLAGLSAAHIAITHYGVALVVAGVQGNASRLDRNFTLALAETAPGTPQTGWRPLVSIKNFSPISDTTVVAVDGAGPVAWRARCQAVFPQAGPGPYYDTLLVSLSEKVDCDVVRNAAPGASFRYYDGAAGYNAQALGAALFSGICISQFDSSFTILVPISSFSITPIEDSLQLTGATTDVAGNGSPPIAVARRAVIEAAEGSTIRIAAGPNNPFNPVSDLRSTPQWPLISSFYSDVIGANTAGTIISIITRIPLEQQSDGSYGRMIIFDAVGNVIRDLPVRKARTDKDYGVLWDGRNKHGRFVGNGSYLALATVKPTGAKKTEKIKIKIGVRR